MKKKIDGKYKEKEGRSEIAAIERRKKEERHSFVGIIFFLCFSPILNCWKQPCIVSEERQVKNIYDTVGFTSSKPNGRTENRILTSFCPEPTREQIPI